MQVELIGCAQVLTVRGHVQQKAADFVRAAVHRFIYNVRDDRMS